MRKLILPAIVAMFVASPCLHAGEAAPEPASVAVECESVTLLGSRIVKKSAARVRAAASRSRKAARKAIDIVSPPYPAIKERLNKGRATRSARRSRVFASIRIN